MAITKKISASETLCMLCREKGWVQLVSIKKEGHLRRHMEILFCCCLKPKKKRERERHKKGGKGEEDNNKEKK